MLESFSNIEFGTLPHEYAGELLILKASALIGLRDGAYEVALTEARARTFSSGLFPLECELHYVAAVAAMVAGRTADALTLLEELYRADVGASPFAGVARADYLYSSGYWRARGHDLQGLVEASREQYAAQAKSLTRAFEEYDRAGIQDVYAEAHMLANFAVLVRELDNEVYAQYLELRSDDLSWNQHCAAAEFEVYRSIGWNRARRGDHLAAYRRFRRAAQCAPSVALQIAAILDRSFLANELGESLTAQDDLDYAIRLGKQIDWTTVQSAQLESLFKLAQCVAASNPRDARFFWDRFVALRSRRSTLELASLGDRREIAKESVAHAAVLRAEGQTKRAATLLFDSFDIFTEVGYASRAASVAIDLYELTGESKFFEVAVREAQKRPQSWIARRVASMRDLLSV